MHKGIKYEPEQDKTNKMICAQDSDQRGHLPGLIGVFAVCMWKHYNFGEPKSTQ